MRWQTLGIQMACVVALAAVLCGPAATRSFAQVDPPVDQQPTNTTVAGVIVDAQGTLSRRIVPDLSGSVQRQRRAAAKAALPMDLAKMSTLRKVSLTRLEQELIARDGVVTDDMRFLAGLYRIEYVFFYPESGDIVIAGPAEGWMNDGRGPVVGINSGRPTLQLQDMAVALRTYPPDANNSPLVSVSIDPTQEGLARMQAFLQKIGHNLNRRPTSSDVQFIATGLRTSLGLQDVSFTGISPNTHFAQVLVEADYRMKLIGIGLERPPVRMTSYIDVARGSSSNALARWYFVPDYQCVRMTDDGFGMQMVGDSVKLVGENEVVSASGTRSKASTGSRASQVFTNSFTKVYSALADRSPVYAELRNLIDMSVVAAYLQREGLYTKAEWKAEFFCDESKYAVETYTAPVRVESTVAAKMDGNRLMTPVGGGVQIQADRALDSENLMYDEKGDVAKLRDETKLNLTKGQWWWD